MHDFSTHLNILQPLPGTTPTMFSVSRMKIDIHFSLIAAAVTYIMWKSVGEDKIKKMEGKKLDDDDFKKRKGYWRVDCQSASKGTYRDFFLFKKNAKICLCRKSLSRALNRHISGSDFQAIISALFKLSQRSD